MIRKWLKKKCYPNHPMVASAEEWCEWEKVEKSKPLCYFFLNTVPSWWDKNIVSPINNGIYWFKYRFLSEYKYHLINTGLKHGYHEIDERMFHGMFNLLKEYCEEEQPYHDWCWQSLDDEKKR